MDIHESCTNNFKQFVLNFTIGFYNHFQPGMYAVVRSHKANHSLVLESCKMTRHSSNTVSLYSQDAAMTFVNWKNVTICEESVFKVQSCQCTTLTCLYKEETLLAKYKEETLLAKYFRRKYSN